MESARRILQADLSFQGQKSLMGLEINLYHQVCFGSLLRCRGIALKQEAEQDTVTAVSKTPFLILIAFLDSSWSTLLGNNCRG